MTPRTRHDQIVYRLVIILMGLCVLVPSCSGASRNLKGEIAKAQEDLRISQAAEVRVAEALERSRQSGELSDQTLKEYEHYHDQLVGLVRENQKKVSNLEALQRKYAGWSTRSAGDKGGKSGGRYDPQIPEESSGDPVAELDRRLDNSLTAFDIALLKEMELIKIQSAAKMEALSDEAQAAKQRLKEQGIDIDAEQTQPQDTAAGRKAPGSGSGSPTASAGTKQPTDTGQPAGRSADQSGTASSGQAETSQHKGSQQEPAGMSEQELKRYGYGKDDDIVARQLREAAQKETDPELRRKLWKEYEDYKKNQ